MEYQTSPFEPIRSFDMPSVAIQQILSNNMTFGSVRDLILPSRRGYLSPEQQASLTEKIKDKYGGDNRALRTMLGIATNPWIWLGAAVSPPAMEAIRRSGSIFAAGRSVATGIGYEKGGLLETLRTLSTNQHLDGTLLPILLEKDVLRRSAAYAIDAKTIEGSLVNYYKSNPHSLASLGLKKPPKDLNEWVQAVGKKVGITKPEKLTKKIFQPDYTGPHENFARTIKKFLALDLAKGYGTVEYLTPKFVPETKVLIESETVVNKLNAIRKNLVDKRGLLGGKKYKDIKWTGKKDYRNIEYDTFEVLAAENAVDVANKETKRWSTDLVDGKLEWGIGEHAGLMDLETANTIRELFHIEPLRNAFRAAYNQRISMILGDDIAYKAGDFYDAAGKPKKFIYDEDKLETIIAGIDPTKGASAIQAHGGKADEAVAEGIDFLRTLLPMEGVAATTMKLSVEKKKEIFKQMIKGTVSSMFKNGTYVPRNTFRDTAMISPYTGKHYGGRDMGTMRSQGVANAESLSNLNRLAPRASASRNYHPEDLEWLLEMNTLHGGSRENAAHLNVLLRKAKGKIKKNSDIGVGTYSYTLDGITGHQRYMKDTAEIYSRNIAHKVYDPVAFAAGVPKGMVPDTAVWGEIVAADQRIRKGGMPAGGGASMDDIFNQNIKWRDSNIPIRDSAGKITGYESVDMTATLKDIVTGKVAGPAGGLTLGDAMAHQHAAMQNRFAADLFKETILPHISARRLPEHGVFRGMQIKSHEMVNAFANGRMGKMIEGWGSHGKEFISNLKSMSTYENLSGVMAKGLYVGFLGVNMMSVMLNMMQPLLHAAMWGGLNNVIPAYGKAFGEIMSYAKERFPLGLRISEAKRAELMMKHFKHVTEYGDLLGITPDVFANIDGATYAGVQSFQKEGMGHFLSMTLPMKMFEKAELMNRLVSAHTVDNIYRGARIRVPDRPKTGAWDKEEMNFFNWMTDTRRFVQEAQFGGSPLNMPTAFLGAGPVGGLVGNPLGRQFLSFLTRAFTSYARTGKQISPERYFKEGVPLLGGKKVWGGHYGADLLRLMGTGALTYEIGKEMFRSDLSRGAGVKPIFEVMGGGWVPPVVAIPLDMVRVGMGDLEFAKSAIPGLIPGGIAFTRAMGMMPRLGESSILPDLADNMQKTYVDWNTTTPDGHHPIFTGDGRIINYEKPFSIVMKGLGVNLENHPKAGEVDGYLAKQREVIVQMESEYMNALIANNIPKARGIEADFKKKFNVPLKISKSQWRSRMRNLETARMERIANTIPSEYKHLYQSTLAEEHKRLGIKSEEEVLAGQTSGQRTKAGASRVSPVKLDPATIEEIKKHLKQQEQKEAPIEDQGFNPFQTWNQ